MSAEHIARRLLMDPEIAEVTRLNDWLDQAFAEAGTDGVIAARLKLCLNEAVSNVIVYAFASNPAPQPHISVEITLTKDGATALLRDNGTPFDPLQWHSRDKITDLATAEIGGFGIKLMRESATELTFERSGGENHLRIVCR